MSYSSKSSDNNDVAKRLNFLGRILDVSFSECSNLQAAWDFKVLIYASFPQFTYVKNFMKSTNIIKHHVKPLVIEYDWQLSYQFSKFYPIETNVLDFIRWW